MTLSSSRVCTIRPTNNRNFYIRSEEHLPHRQWYKSPASPVARTHQQLPAALERMTISLANPVKYLRGVGPHRAAILEERGLPTVGDLLGYLPFRYEDRIRFTPIAEIIPGQVHTILAEVTSGGGGTVRFARGRAAIFHASFRDGSGTLHARFFHGAYLEATM